MKKKLTCITLALSLAGFATLGLANPIDNQLTIQNKIQLPTTNLPAGRVLGGYLLLNQGSFPINFNDTYHFAGSEFQNKSFQHFIMTLYFQQKNAPYGPYQSSTVKVNIPAECKVNPHNISKLTINGHIESYPTPGGPRFTIRNLHCRVQR